YRQPRPVAVGRPLRRNQGGGLRREAEAGGHSRQGPACRAGPVRSRRSLEIPHAWTTTTAYRTAPRTKQPYDARQIGKEPGAQSATGSSSVSFTSSMTM